MTRTQIKLIYDKQCPLCDFYCQLIYLQESYELELVDARTHPEALEPITARGWDIDQGMVLMVGETYFYAEEAIHKLATLANSKTLFNRFNRWFFSSGWRARQIYPILRWCRNLLLKCLGKTRINNLQRTNNDRF